MLVSNYSVIIYSEEAEIEILVNILNGSILTNSSMLFKMYFFSIIFAVFIVVCSRKVGQNNSLSTLCSLFNAYKYQTDLGYMSLS